MTKPPLDSGPTFLSNKLLLRKRRIGAISCFAYEGGPTAARESREENSDVRKSLVACE
jgi:hypothetical protein